MKSETGGVTDQIADAANNIGSVAQDQARRGLQQARANMGSMVADASDRLGVVADTAQSQAVSIGGSLEDAVRERPLPVLAIALGFGFLVGMIWRR